MKKLSEKALTRKLDNVFREIMKSRQLQKGHFRCFVCKQDKGGFFHPKERPFGLQVIHFIGRTVFSLRWDFDNCEMGCSSCNRIHEENILPHTYAIIKEYGEERIDTLNTKYQAYKRVGKSMTKAQKLEKLEELEKILDKC